MIVEKGSISWVQALIIIGATTKHLNATFKMKIIKGLFLAVIAFSCTSEVKQMDEWESQVAEKLKADRVELYHRSTSTTIDDQLPEEESYIELDIYNSKVLDSIKHNEKFLSEKCDSIANAVVNSPLISVYPNSNELRVAIITTSGFGIFKSENTNTITFNINKEK